MLAALPMRMAASLVSSRFASSEPTASRGDDGVGVGAPDERPWRLVVLGAEAVGGGLEGIVTLTLPMPDFGFGWRPADEISVPYGSRPGHSEGGNW